MPSSLLLRSGHMRILMTVGHCNPKTKGIELKTRLDDEFRIQKQKISHCSSQRILD